MQRHCLERFEALDSVHEFSSCMNRSQRGPNLWSRFQESPFFYSWKEEMGEVVYFLIFWHSCSSHGGLSGMSPWAAHASGYACKLLWLPVFMKAGCFYEVQNAEAGVSKQPCLLRTRANVSFVLRQSLGPRFRRSVFRRRELSADTVDPNFHDVAHALSLEMAVVRSFLRDWHQFFPPCCHFVTFCSIVRPVLCVNRGPFSRGNNDPRPNEIVYTFFFFFCLPTFSNVH